MLLKLIYIPKQIVYPTNLAVSAVSQISVGELAKWKLLPLYLGK